MKKRMLSFFLIFIILIGILPTVFVSAEGTLSAVCTDYTVLFKISGAVLLEGEAMPEGNGGLLNIIVTDASDKLVITPTFSETKADISEATSDRIEMDLSSDIAEAEFDVVFTDSTMQGGKWLIAVIIQASEEDEAASLTFSADLNESEIKYIQGKMAATLTTCAEHSKGEAVTYQWYSNTKKSTEGGTAIQGATSGSYTPLTDIIGTTYYYVEAFGGNLTQISKIVTVTIVAPVINFKKNLDGREARYLVGMQAAELMVDAEYTDITKTVAYQWYSNCENSTEGGAAIPGATSASYTPATDAQNTTYYYVVASCDGVSATSQTAKITTGDFPLLTISENVIDIRDNTVWAEFDYYAKATDLKIVGADVEKAIENDSIINIVLDNKTPKDAQISFEFGTMLNKAEMSGHTGEIKLNNGKAAIALTLFGKSADITSWKASAEYILNFSVGAPYVEKIEITKLPEKTTYDEGEKFNPAGMEVTAYYSDSSSGVVEKYTYTPEGQLTTAETTITVKYNGNDKGSNLLPVTINIVVNKRQSGGGSLGGDDNDEDSSKSEPIEVYMTFVNRGEIVAQDESIIVYDENNDGKFCIGEAFLAFHRDYYSGGESGYKEISGNGVVGWVSKFWGRNDATFTYALNRSWAKSTDDIIKEGDIIAAVNGVDEMFYSDLITWFEEKSYKAQAGKELKLKVNGLNIMASKAGYDSLHTPFGADVTVFDSDGNEVSGMGTAVEKDGSFTLTFEEGGSYTVKISGKAKWGSYNDAPVAPSTCEVSVSGGIGGDDAHNSSGSLTSTENNEKEKATVLTRNITADSSGKAEMVLSTEEICEAVLQADEENESTVNIAPVISGDVNKVTITIPGEGAEKLSEVGYGLDFFSDIADIRLSGKAISALAEQNGELIISASKKDDGIVGINVSVGDKTADKISGGIKIGIPKTYEGNVMVMVKDDGTSNIITKHAVTDEGHFAILPGSADVKITDNHKAFTDTSGHWGEEYIEFVSGRELYQGVGEGRFDAEGAMTRAMLVTVLHRYEGAQNPEKSAEFDDVTEDKWFFDAVSWAAVNDIVNGVAENSFAPDKEVTREQACAILYRYAGYIEMPTEQKGDTTRFKDNDKVSEWAKDAISWAVGTGIISGRTEELLDPNGNANRVEVAAMLQRFTHIMVK